MMTRRLLAIVGSAALLAGCARSSAVPAPLAPPVPYASTSTVHHVYVANSSANTIDVFKSTATGDVAPIRRIRGANTELSDPQ